MSSIRRLVHRSSARGSAVTRLPRSRVAALVAVIVVAVLGIAVALSGFVENRAVAVGTVATTPPPPVSAATVAVPKLAVPPAIVADAAVPAVQLYSSPGEPWPNTAPFTNPTPQGQPLVFLVHQIKGPWLQVQVSARPNGLLAWIRRSDVHLRTDPYRIVVSLSGHRVSLYRGATEVLSTPAAVGKPSSPTPTGSFFVDAIIPLSYDTGPYGAGAMGISAFSDVYEHFGGGPGQIAIHGTDEPWLIGRSVSHGCVRIANDVWRTITALAPTGTPVRIEP